MDPKCADFPWMLAVDDGQGMVCSLCHKHNQHPKKSAFGRTVCAGLVCQSLMKLSLGKYSESESHITAEKKEADHHSSRKDGGIAMAFHRFISAQHKLFVSIL